MNDLAPAVAHGAMILPLLNGMRHIDSLVRRFGETAVLGGVCLISAILDQQGRIRQFSDMQEIAYGERDGLVSERVRALDAGMRGAGFDARLSSTIIHDMWERWVMLATAAGITCLLRGNVGEIEAIPDRTSLASSSFPGGSDSHCDRIGLSAQRSLRPANRRAADRERVELRSVNVSRRADEPAR